MTILFQVRRDTFANWSSNNTVLLSGEIGWDTTNRKGKIGDGSTAWNSLEYSTFTLSELNAKANISSPTFTGVTSASMVNVSGNLSVVGNLTVSGAIEAQEIREAVADVTLTSNVATLNWTAANIFYIATAPTANMTFNVTNVPTDNSRISNVSIFVTQGATGFIPTTFQIEGQASTIRWVGGVAPIPTSSAGKIDIFSFTMQRTSTGGWIVYGNSSLGF